jgi:Kef-type K+ transport system membrane component KefB
VAAGLLLPRRSGDRWLMGIGMIPRGEVGLIFAGFGLAHGVLSNSLYSALIAVMLLTTLVTPPLLKLRARRRAGAARAAASDDDVSAMSLPAPHRSPPVEPGPHCEVERAAG